MGRPRVRDRATLSKALDYEPPVLSGETMARLCAQVDVAYRKWLKRRGLPAGKFDPRQFVQQ